MVRSALLLSCVVFVLIDSALASPLPLRKPRRALSPWSVASLATQTAKKQHAFSQQPAAPYKVHWFDQTLNHFGFDEAPTWKQRYLTNSDFWGKPNGEARNSSRAAASCPGPVLFYTGNEGDITLFWQNTGFVTDYLIKKLGALVVFTEHRYYGEVCFVDPPALPVLDADREDFCCSLSPLERARSRTPTCST
jgi:Serine carboxypeptidase S28